MFTKINTKINESRDEEGFTLIELLVVILIIGILAAIAIPVFLNQQKAAVKGGIKSDVHNTTLNVALSLAEYSNSTGFVTYKAGDATPTLTAGQAAVKTVNTKDDVITVTNNPADNASPSTGAGNGAWNDYQVVGSNPSLPNYCFVFSSLSGKYTEYNDCTVAAGTGTGSGSTATPTTPTTPASTPATTNLVTYGFEGNTTPWAKVDPQTSLKQIASVHNNGAYSMIVQTSTSLTMTAEAPVDMVVGQKYRATAYVRPFSTSTSVIVTVQGKTVFTTPAVTDNTFQKVTTDFTYDGTGTGVPRIGFGTIRPSGAVAIFYLDDVTLDQVN